MLRQVFLENFVRFKQKHELCFENGAHFFVGANNSGKSSFFEGIRRCLSTSKSTTLSSSYDDTKASIVLSVFATNETNGDIVSGIIGLPAKTKDDEVYVKLAFRKDGQYGIDVVKKDSTEAIVNKAVKTEYIEQSNCINILNAICEKKVSDTTQLIDEVENLIRTSNGSGDNDFEKNNDTDCNKILKELDKCIVNTFPNRGIGPLQWSHSHLVDHSSRESNYATAQDKAEIIKWYVKEQSKLKREETDREQMYYNRITDDCGFNFKMSGDELKCFCRKRKSQRSENEEIEISLLKLPQGLLEAKHSSILCAVKQFTTVILEDPEKGMHPQMISRMCDMVYNKINDKVILVSSHHPSFISYKSIQNVFLLKRIICEKENYSKILRVGQEVAEHEQKTKEKDITRLTNTDFRNILYAENVFFVEGDTDLWFMESLKDCLLRAESDDMKSLLSTHSSNSDVDKFKSSLSTLVIMPVHSIRCIIPYSHICMKLEIKAASLEDKSEFKTDKFQKTRFKWDVGDFEDVFIELANWEQRTKPEKKVTHLLEKVMTFEIGDDGSILKKGKFGKRGSRRDIDDLIEIAIKVTGDKDEPQLDSEKPCGQIRNLVLFLQMFLTK